MKTNKMKASRPGITTRVDPELKKAAIAKAAAKDRKIASIIRALLRKWVNGEISE